MTLDQKLEALKGVIGDETVMSALRIIARFFDTWQRLPSGQVSKAESDMALLGYLGDLSKNPAWATMGLAVIAAMVRAVAVAQVAGADLPNAVIKETALTLSIVTGDASKTTALAALMKDW